MNIFIFGIICAITWMWRGASFPKFIHGYLRGLITSFIICGSYYLFMPNMTIFSYSGLISILTLTIVEGSLGYGSTCENIDYEYCSDVLPNNYRVFVTEIKESYTYLGFICMSYYLFPYMILNPEVSIIKYFCVAILGFSVYPLAKYCQLRFINKLVDKYYWLDSWKIVEGILGLGFVLWFIK